MKNIEIDASLHIYEIIISEEYNEKLNKVYEYVGKELEKQNT